MEEARDVAADLEEGEVGPIRKFCAIEAFPTLEEVTEAFRE